MPHKLSLIIPGLCGPIPDSEDLHASAVPLLDLLRSLRKEKISAADEVGVLADLFGLGIDAPFPYAAVALLAYGHDPGSDCWLHADPVNLQADMDRAILSDARTLHIREDEAEKLVEQINAHFSEDGLSLIMADADNWFVRLDDCGLLTTPLDQAVGRNVNHLLPEGSRAAVWKRILNEAQMLLHMSDVNQQREHRGMDAINSLWFWGEGRLPQPGDSDVTHVYADDAVTSGLAVLNRTKHSALTDPVVLASAMKQHGHSLVSLQQLVGACNYGDTPAWLDAMRELVEDWLAASIEAARSLHAEVNIYPCNGVRYHLGHHHKFDISKLIFWKKDRLQDHVETQ